MTTNPTQYAYVEVFDSSAPARLSDLDDPRNLRRCWRYAGIAKRVSLKNEPTPLIDDESRQAIRNAQLYLSARAVVLAKINKPDDALKISGLATGLARVLDKIGGAK